MCPGVLRECQRFNQWLLTVCLSPAGQQVNCRLFIWIKYRKLHWKSLIRYTSVTSTLCVCVVSVPPVYQRERLVISAALPVRQDTRGDTVRGNPQVGEGPMRNRVRVEKLVCSSVSTHHLTFILKFWPQCYRTWHHTDWLSSYRCSVGYYGNPSLPGGVCSRCNCSGWGSLQSLCDVLSGQCECKTGVKGQSCDQCDERHVLQEGECVCEYWWYRQRHTHTVICCVLSRLVCLCACFCLQHVMMTALAFCWTTYKKYTTTSCLQNRAALPWHRTANWCCWRIRAETCRWKMCEVTICWCCGVLQVKPGDTFPVMFFRRWFQRIALSLCICPE